MTEKNEEKFELVCDDCGAYFEGKAEGEVCPKCGSSNVWVGEYNWPDDTFEEGNCE